jgi:hypothetical protein
MHAHAIAPAQPASLSSGLSLFGQSDDDADQVVLHHLVTPQQIEAVLPLREGIDLSAHAAAGDAFLALEKKETSWASSARSSAPGA